MIKIENTEVYGWEAAIRGMRNPMNSWEKSDSEFCVFDCEECKYYDKEHPNRACVGNTALGFVIGDNDMELMEKLVSAGSDHSKFMRMITVTCDITAPMYWWKEFDTYKVGTVRNSCSTMHKIHSKKFTIDDFSYEHLISDAVYHLTETIGILNDCREAFINFDEVKNDLSREIKDKKDLWWQMIQLLPSSYNQRATVQLNYAVLRNMYHSRKNHKLDEWHDFCHWVEALPYSELITGYQEVHNTEGVAASEEVMQAIMAGIAKNFQHETPEQQRERRLQSYISKMQEEKNNERRKS